MKNKDGLRNTVVVALLVMVAIFGTMFAVGGMNTSDADSPEAVASSCALDTTLTTSIVDEYNRGTAVESVTMKYSQDGGNSYSNFVSGTTKLEAGLPVKLFLSKDDYIDKVVDLPAVKCGPNSKQITIAATDAIGIVIYDKQMNELTDSATGGSANLPAVNTGASAKAIVELIGNNNEQSGDLVIVVETSATANVSEIKLGSLSKVDTPSFYSQAATGTAVQAFELSSLDDNAEYSDTLTIIPKSAKDINGAVYVTVYSKQAFQDTNGKVAVGVENVEGTNKYEDTYDFDFLIE